MYLTKGEFAGRNGTSQQLDFQICLMVLLPVSFQALEDLSRGLFVTLLLVIAREALGCLILRAIDSGFFSCY